MKPYQEFYQKQTAFLRKWKNPEKGLTLLNKSLTILIGLLYLVGASLSAFSVFGSPLPTLFAIGLPLACTLVCVTLLRLLFPRKRPHEKHPDLQPVCQKRKNSPSFPSRHTACAFVIGTVLCKLAWWLSIPSFALGTCLAYVRFLSGFHYPSDLLGGAALGAGLGLLSFLF